MQHLPGGDTGQMLPSPMPTGLPLSTGSADLQHAFSLVLAPSLPPSFCLVEHKV